MFQDYEYEYEEDPNAIEGLPASAADLLDAPYDDGFNCDQQDAGYGYYADTLNNCQVNIIRIMTIIFIIKILLQHFLWYMTSDKHNTPPASYIHFKIQCWILAFSKQSWFMNIKVIKQQCNSTGWISHIHTFIMGAKPSSTSLKSST